MTTQTTSVTRTPANAPPCFHLLAKPSGSTCNLNCTYCFFLSKEALYPNEKSRMSEATLEAYISSCSSRIAPPKSPWRGRAASRR